MPRRWVFGEENRIEVWKEMEERPFNRTKQESSCIMNLNLDSFIQKFLWITFTEKLFKWQRKKQVPIVLQLSFSFSQNALLYFVWIKIQTRSTSCLIIRLPKALLIVNIYTPFSQFFHTIDLLKTDYLVLDFSDRVFQPEFWVCLFQRSMKLVKLDTTELC